MTSNSRQDNQFEWVILTRVGKSLYTGSESETVLGNLFAMWVQDRGELSAWESAPAFGALVNVYSDLALPVVAVWLGLDPEEIYEADIPESGPPWRLTAPDGGEMVIEKRTTRNPGD